MNSWRGSEFHRLRNQVSSRLGRINPYPHAYTLLLLRIYTTEWKGWKSNKALGIRGNEIAVDYRNHRRLDAKTESKTFHVFNIDIFITTVHIYLPVRFLSVLFFFSKQLPITRRPSSEHRNPLLRQRGWVRTASEGAFMFGVNFNKFQLNSDV